FHHFISTEKPTPTVSVTPQSSVYTGDSVTLSCNLMSTGWTFLWYEGQESNPPSLVASDTNTHTVTVSREGRVNYYCKARRGDYDSEISDPATITVTARPKAVVSVQAADPDNVFTGETITFSCEIKTRGSWQYHWFRDNKEVSDAKANKTYLQMFNNGAYTCRGTQSSDPKYTQTSDAVTLTVSGDEEVMGKFGVKERNLEGQMVVDFAKRMDMGVVNIYFQKREEHRVTYKSGGRSTQVDYILCRRGNLKEISDCKVVVGESVARQHRMVVCRMTLMVYKKKRSEIEIEKKTKWWKLKKEECCEEFRQKLRQALGGQVVLPDDWETTAEVIRETGRKVLGVSSGRRKEDKETWWWNEEVQDSIQRKRLAKKKWDMNRTEENRQEYKELQRRVKKEVSKAKQKAYDEL
ncbi:hypothetical protein QTP86_021051, partial [Hemibagrus guttatus]